MTSITIDFPPETTNSSGYMLFFGDYNPLAASRSRSRPSSRRGALLLWIAYAVALVLHGAHHIHEARQAAQFAAAEQRTISASAPVSFATPAPKADHDADCPECQALLLLGAALLFAARAPKAALALPQLVPAFVAAPARISPRRYRRHAARAPPRLD